MAGFLKHPSGAEAQLSIPLLAARLKPCPCYKAFESWPQSVYRQPASPELLIGFVPAMNPRPTARMSFSTACEAGVGLIGTVPGGNCTAGQANAGSGRGATA